MNTTQQNKLVELLRIAREKKSIPARIENVIDAARRSAKEKEQK